MDYRPDLGNQRIDLIFKKFAFRQNVDDDSQNRRSAQHGGF